MVDFRTIRCWYSRLLVWYLRTSTSWVFTAWVMDGYNNSKRIGIKIPVLFVSYPHFLLIQHLFYEQVFIIYSFLLRPYSDNKSYYLKVFNIAFPCLLHSAHSILVSNASSLQKSSLFDIPSNFLSTIRNISSCSLLTNRGQIIFCIL